MLLRLMVHNGWGYKSQHDTQNIIDASADYPA